MMRRVLLFLSASVLAFAPMTAAHASGHYHVTVKLNHTKITKGDKVTVSGKVTGGPVSGQKVDIVAYEGAGDVSGNVKVGSASLSGSGAYSRSFKPPTAGLWTFRVVKHHLGSTSGVTAYSADPLKVYHWMSLTHFYDADDSTGIGDIDTTETINGHTYPHSFSIATGDHLAFNPLDGQFYCTSYQAYIGLSDASAAGALGEYKAVISGTNHVVDDHSKHQGVNASFVHTKMFSTVHLLVMTAQFDPDVAGNRFIIGSPKLFCATP
jgi:hypothetical protein